MNNFPVYFWKLLITRCNIVTQKLHNARDRFKFSLNLCTVSSDLDNSCLSGGKQFTKFSISVMLLRQWLAFISFFFFLFHPATNEFHFYQKPVNENPYNTCELFSWKSQHLWDFMSTEFWHFLWSKKHILPQILTSPLWSITLSFLYLKLSLSPVYKLSSK